jgi:hypothetical protein
MIVTKKKSLMISFHFYSCNIMDLNAATQQNYPSNLK